MPLPFPAAGQWCPVCVAIQKHPSPASQGPRHQCPRGGASLFAPLFATRSQAAAAKLLCAGACAVMDSRRRWAEGAGGGAGLPCRSHTPNPCTPKAAPAATCSPTNSARRPLHVSLQGSGTASGASALPATARTRGDPCVAATTAAATTAKSMCQQPCGRPYLPPSPASLRNLPPLPQRRAGCLVQPSQEGCMTNKD